jgi:mortality factor 4-like protein 1
VLVYCNTLLYEGICMERGRTEFGYKQYFIHYKGWNKHWDEWVHEVELLEMNAINYGHKQRLQERQ